MSNMGNQTAAAAMGAVVALTRNSREYRYREDRDRRETNRQVSSVQALAETASSKINDLISSGDITRLGVDTVNDLLLGLAFGGDREDQPPSALGTPSSPENRPVISEALAVASQQWPPGANDYDGKGNLKHPSHWLRGQNALTGLVLGFAEIRAFLAGLTTAKHPDSFQQAQFTRAARGLSNVLVDAANAVEPMTQAQHDSLWRKLFGMGEAAYPAGVIYSQVSDGPILSNTAAEIELSDVPWPKGLLANPGDVAEVIFSGRLSGNADVTGRIRLDNAGGNAVLSQWVYDPAVTMAFTQRMVITRRADAGGSEVYQCSGDFSDASVADIVTLAPATDHRIVWTGQFATAAVTNTAVAKTSVLRKY